MRRDWRLLLGLLWLFTSACRDEKPLPQPEPAGNERMYVLNEGLFNMNNSTITLFDPESRSALTDYFEITNGRKMGDTGNDMAIYGGKLYVVLSGSSQVEVMAAATGKSLRQIPLFDGQRARQPRAIAFLDRHAFIACFDGTVIALDTASLQITGMAIAGSNPDGITVAGGKLYVSNSGGLNFPHYDNTISVIDPTTMTELRRIPVGVNPGSIAADRYGEVYVVCRGNYGSIPSSLVIIDSRTDAVKLTLQNQLMQVFIYGDTAWLTHIDYSGSMQSRIALMDVRSKQMINESFISDGTMPETVYGIHVDRSLGVVYVADARSFVHTGVVNAYDRQGRKQFSFSSGMNPSKMVMW